MARHSTAIGEDMNCGGEVALSDSRLSMALGITPKWAIHLTQVARACEAWWGGRPRPRPAPWPARSRRTRASAAVQGDRPTKPLPERLPESSRYPAKRLCATDEHR